MMKIMEWIKTDKYQQKEAEIAILITDKVEFKVKIMKQDNDVMYYLKVKSHIYTPQNSNM